ncbi:CAMK family protein kinase [Tritrichomonas foetus]|uniref:non-specific serine/threonine protein kinase n=1 Tax=Tritrichomonas foetus TaxID=1144522 RepID=A0A1J4L103_9EUKA|nr:CAMK family protein kinase [Tritrichomonas foetus]|eukprot:OHT17115.1 CAMK family protein kinase [Tritrichomonas foetus]
MIIKVQLTRKRFIKKFESMKGSLHVGNYTLLYRIGSGSFANVFMGINDLNGLPVAIKQISKQSLTTEKEKVRLEREISIMKRAMHQYIVELFEIIDTDDYVYLVMELVQNGSIKSLLVPNQPMSEEKCRKIFSQVIVAVGYLHNNLNIIHRDLKAENILFDKNENIRLIDFGLSTSSQPEVLRTACGSPAYAAPEIILHDNYTQSADIWSIGILLYLMSTGKLPFDTSSVTKLLNYIVTSPIEIPTTLSSDLQNLISRILQKNPEKRITIEEMMRHPWFTRAGYFMFQTSSNRTPFDSLITDDSIDISIVQELVHKGIDVKELRTSLLNSDFNELTAVYRIKRRAKLMEEFDGKLNSPENNMFRFSTCPIKDSGMNIAVRNVVRRSFSKTKSSQYPINQNPPKLAPRAEFGKRKRLIHSIPRPSPLK